MNSLDTMIFVMELFKLFRTPERPPSALYPLNPECLDAIKADIKKRQKKLNPREIIHRLATLLELSRKKAKAGINPEVSCEEAIALLNSFNDIE
jgi:hypothetical protein